MCRTATIYSAPAFELHAKMIHGQTLELYSRHPTANNPELHRVFQVTLPKDDLLFLADFIKLNVEK